MFDHRVYERSLVVFEDSLALFLSCFNSFTHTAIWFLLRDLQSLYHFLFDSCGFSIHQRFDCFSFFVQLLCFCVFSIFSLVFDGSSLDFVDICFLEANAVFIFFINLGFCDSFHHFSHSFFSGCRDSAWHARTEVRTFIGLYFGFWLLFFDFLDSLLLLWYWHYFLYLLSH